MKPPLIPQLTMFTCVADCWAHYMRERGLHITSEDILKNHRDLCWWDQPLAHQYGTIRRNDFPVLVSRYKLTATPFVPNAAQDVLLRISNGEGIFLLAEHYPHPNNGHILRIIGGALDDLEFITPGLPWGEHRTVPFANFAAMGGAYYSVS
jgi:hypothetical protein